MRFVLFAGVAGTFLALAGCQSTQKPASPAEEARRLTYAKVEAEVTKADCALVDLLNKRRASAGGKAITAGDCVYFRREGTLEGYRDRPLPLPNLAINAVPLPIGTLARVAHRAEKNRNERRAVNADIPEGVVARGTAAETVYRKMIRRGFEEEEVMAVSGTGTFSASAAATRKALAVTAGS